MNSFSFVQVMPGSSQDFVDLMKFQYLHCRRPVFSSGSPDSEVRIKKAPKSWLKPGLLAYRLHSSEILGWPQSSWVAFLRKLILGAASCLLKSQVPSDNFRFAGVSKRKVLKHEFLKSNHFGLTQSKKTHKF